MGYRVIVYPGETPEDTDILLTNKFAYIANAKLAAAVLGTGTLLNNFTCTQTASPSMMVDVTAGEIYSLQNIDNNAYGSIAPDTAHAIVKQGVMFDPITLSCPAPLTSGQSINYLIEIGFSEADGGSTVSPYYNSTDPEVPFAGPNNNAQPNNTQRQDTVNIVAKAGTSATTGTQTTPSPDTGFTGAFVVTVAFGATTITNSNISTFSGAPFITETLTQKISEATGDARYLRIGGIQTNQYLYSADTGIANAYVGSLTPALTTYNAGMVVYIDIANTNTSASCTLNINGVGASTIHLTNGNAINIGDLVAGQEALFVNDGTNWQLINPATWASQSQVQTNSFCYAADTGSANAYAIALSPAITSYAAGMCFQIKILNANTGASTLAVNGLTAKSLTYINTNALAANEVIAGQIADVFYDGTRFQLLNPAITNSGALIPLSRGGTNATLSLSNGGIVYCGSSGLVILAATSTALQMLQSGANGAPSWSTATYPATTTINQILWSNLANQVTGLATAANSTLNTSSGGVPSFSSTLPSAVQGNITTVGTLSGGTWNATIIGMAYGGTNANLSASNGGIVYSTSSALAIFSGTATAGQIIRSGASTTPSWSTATYPADIAINQLLMGTAAHVFGALATAINGMLVTDGSGNISWNTSGLNVTQGGTGLTTATTAYGVVCAGTTATGAFQVLASLGSAGQVLTSNGAAALPSMQSVAASAVTKVGTTVASNTASIAFTSFVANSYYELVLQNLLPATDGTSLWLILGTGATPTYHTSSTNYNAVYETAFQVGTAASVNGEVSGGAAQMVLDDTIGGTTNRGISGFIRIYNPSITSTYTLVTWELSRMDSSGNLRRTSGSGQYTTAGTAVTAAKVQFAAGNITSGQITCLSAAS